MAIPNFTTKKCFVIMPISTPEHLLARYGNDPDHFTHVYDYLIKPALESLGIEPISPVTPGAGVIHGEIIKNIETAELVLCDISSLNPNVFFELGIRTAVNKPAIIIRDSLTENIPFDTSVMNTHTYSAELSAWIVEREIPKLKSHIDISIKKSDGNNEFLKIFSLTIRSETVKAARGVEGKMDALTLQVEALRREFASKYSAPEEEVSHQGSRLRRTIGVF